MSLDLPQLAPLVTRFRLLEVLEHRADLIVVRAEDSLTGGRARIVFLRETSGKTPSAQLVALTTQGRLLEAGHGADYAYVALADEDEAATTALLAPAIAPVAPPPLSFWVRVRPFVAAFVLVLSGLVGLHVWDQMRLAGETDELASAPGEWGGGGSGGTLSSFRPRVTPMRPTPSPQPTRERVNVAQAASLATLTAQPPDPPTAQPPTPTQAPTDIPTQAPTTSPTLAPTQPPAPRAAPARVAVPIIQPTAAPVYRPPVVKPPVAKPPVVKPPAPGPTVAPPRPTVAPPRPTALPPSNWSAPVQPTPGWTRSK